MKLTVFTPTYNRITQLPGLYGSIVAAMAHAGPGDWVEWLIVDDGSETDISECVASFSEVEGLTIRLEKKENGGKHTAFNLAIDLADGDIFVCIDDDDRLTENAIADIFACAKRYSDRRYGGIVGRVVDENGTMLGRTIFEDALVSNTMEIRDKYHFWGEPEIFYTDVLKNYRFDVFPGERFLTEAYVFDKMSLAHPFVYTNIPLMVKVYLPGGLTDNQLRIRMESPVGTEAYYFQRKQLTRGFRHKLKATINRRRFARYSDAVPRRPFDFYECIAVPVAWLLAQKDRRDCPPDEK